MGLFKKKMSDEELIKSNIESQQAESEAKDAEKNKKGSELGDSKLAIEVTKIQAQLEGLNEYRKMTNERFSSNSEEMGEVRGMVVETNKAVSRIEAAATRAIDMVESVKPDQLLVEVRKQDSKQESLKANIETNESLMADLMKEIKEIRKRMDFYKGVEQVAKMNDEIKKELIDIKKTEAVIERHSNKVETIFLEIEKRFTEFDTFTDVAKELQKSTQRFQGDIDKLRVRAEDKADKKELLKFITKFNDFEKHTTNIINLLDERSKSATQTMEKQLESISLKADRKMDAALKKLNLEVDITEKQKEEKKTEGAPKVEPKESKSLMKKWFSKSTPVKENDGEGKQDEQTKT